MYIPASFRVDDAETIAAFIQRYGFATLVTNAEQTPFATHLPMQLIREAGDSGILVGHLARANPQWQHFGAGHEVLAIFQGPHSYISPSWYTVSESVPTWNYAAVHVYGIPRVIEDRERVDSILNDLIDFYERDFEQPWKPVLSPAYRDKMVKAIVAFEIRITRIEAKFKLGQNRNADDIRSVFETLENADDQDANQLAELMRRQNLVHDPQ